MSEGREITPLGPGLEGVPLAGQPGLFMDCNIVCVEQSVLKDREALETLVRRLGFIERDEGFGEFLVKFTLYFGDHFVEADMSLRDFCMNSGINRLNLLAVVDALVEAMIDRILEVEGEVTRA